jgi:hypothetical protein
MTFRIELRVKNAPLYNAIMNRHASVAEFCRTHQLEQNQVGALIGLKLSPLNKYNEWRTIALRVADSLGVIVDDLFPEHLRLRLEKTSAALEIDASELNRLLDSRDPLLQIENKELVDATAKALASLSPREAYVLKRRFGFGGAEAATFLDIGNELGVTSTRVQQLEDKALRKLRHPSRAGVLMGFLDTPPDTNASEPL